MSDTTNPPIEEPKESNDPVLYYGTDVDTEALADVLRELANGLDDRTIGATHVDIKTSAAPSDAIATTLSVEYMTTTEHESLLYPHEVFADLRKNRPLKRSTEGDE